MEKQNIVIGLIVLLIIVVLCFGVYFQHKKNDVVAEKKEETVNNVENKESEKTLVEVDYLEIMKEQLAEPKQGETIAKIHVKDFGVMEVKFFKEEAPKAVENFLTHAKNGYYNGLTFHRVINEFMIQGGDPKGDGTGGESIWKEPFENEVDIKRFPFRGTIAMAKSSLPKSIGSQFFITQANADQTVVNNLKMQSISENLIEAYKTYGGYPSLFMGYTVFGQVYKGFDVLDNIAKVSTDLADKPTTPVIIEKIEVIEL